MINKCIQQIIIRYKYISEVVYFLLRRLIDKYYIDEILIERLFHRSALLNNKKIHIEVCISRNSKL